MKETINSWFEWVKLYEPEFYKRHSKIAAEYNSCKNEDEIKEHISKHATFYNRYKDFISIPTGVYEDNLTKFEVV